MHFSQNIIINYLVLKTTNIHLKGTRHLKINDLFQNVSTCLVLVIKWTLNFIDFLQVVEILSFLLYFEH